MKLTDEQEKAFLNGNYPRLSWPEPFDCPATVVLKQLRSHGVHEATGEKGTTVTPLFAVTVVNLKRKPVKGKAWEYCPTEVRVLDVRPETLLRKSPPAHRSKRGSVMAPESGDVEKAAFESAYTSVPALALGGRTEVSDPGEGVPRSWEDRGAMKRKVQAIDDRDSQRRADDFKRQRKTAKATLDAALAGLTPEGKQALLAKVIADCKAAQMEDAA